MAKVKLEIEIDIAPYKASVEPLDRFHATANVKVVSSDHPVRRTEFRSFGPLEGYTRSQAISWAIGYALDQLHFEGEE